MKIIEHYKVDKTFNDINYGQCFKFGNKYYMVATMDGIKTFAVDVNSGECKNFSPTDIVHEVDAVFNVENVH